MQSAIDKLSLLFHQWSGNTPDAIVPLPPAGSERKYFRLKSGDKTAIGAWSPVKEENKAFLHFTQHFLKHRMHVPEIYGNDAENDIYLIEDLGNASLFSMLPVNNPEESVSGEIIALYRKSLQELVRFQVIAGKDLDYSYCYPYPAFDRQAMQWDLNYFKYYFLKLHVTFHEEKLENDFNTLAAYLSKTDGNYFMYRDFQSRNIMVRENQPYFIDYQGGRKGPLQYDLASLLFQVRADLPFTLREELLEFYITELNTYFKTNPQTFTTSYYGFVLIRLLQVLGAYGFRGLIEKKAHFLLSIPYALKNLRWWLGHVELPVQIPELLNALESLTLLNDYPIVPATPQSSKLKVSVKSFSYRHSIPIDKSGNGGGFVFDCRALPNPGREENYRGYTGRDPIIIAYLKDKQEVMKFIQEAENLVYRSVENYLERGFGHLAVDFGCTGGRHRSVYCAETLAKRLREKYPELVIELEHTALKA